MGVGQEKFWVGDHEDVATTKTAVVVIDASVRPPDLYPGGPELRLRHRELVALDDVREPFGFREGTV